MGLYPFTGLETSPDDSLYHLSMAGITWCKVVRPLGHPWGHHDLASDLDEAWAAQVPALEENERGRKMGL